MWTIKILAASHVLFAALFVGGNIFMDFLLTPRLDVIPPGQAARLGEKLGTDFAYFNFICLGGIMITGVLIRWKAGFVGSVFDWDYLQTSPGAALLIKEVIWTTLIFTGLAMTFYLRPRVIVKLPYDASREVIEADREATLRYSNWMRWMARYNGGAAVVALIAGSLMAKGGLW